MSDPKLDAAIKGTMGTMGKLITKPPMTKKLLKKPPFRFLYDTVMEVMKVSPFGAGLYTPEEINSDAVKEKAAKINFLEKAINATAFASGTKLVAKPSKIVAGLDPEATNIWLAALAGVAADKVDTTEAVKRVNAGEKPGKAAKPKLNSEKTGKTGKTSKGDKDKEGDPKKKEGEPKKKEGESKKKEGEPKKREGAPKKKKKDGKDRARPGKATGERKRPTAEDEAIGEPAPAPEGNARQGEPTPDPGQDAGGELEPEQEPDAGEAPVGPEAAGDGGNRETYAEVAQERQKRPMARPKSRGGGSLGRPPPDDEEGDRDASDEARQRPARPSSARRQRPDPNEEFGGPPPDPEEEDIPARPRAPTARRKKGSAELSTTVEPVKQVEIIGGNDDDDDDDDDDNFVVEEVRATPVAPVAGDAEEDDGEHGALMRKIQEKKEVDTSELAPTAAPTVNEAQRRKDQEKVAAEVGELRESIQTLCRTANPLGKIVDYVQEDVDSMQVEMAQWQGELSKDSATLADEALITAKELQPYNVKLTEVDQQIRDQEDMIRAVKANTYENDERIQKLLKGIAFAANA